MKKYENPEIESISIVSADVITTSEIEAGVETTPTEMGGGSWETL